MRASNNGTSGCDPQLLSTAVSSLRPVVVLDKLVHRSSQMTLAQRYDPIEAFLLD